MRNVIFGLILSLSAFAVEIPKDGDGPSNGGDPAQFQVYERADFALEKIKLGKMLPADQIAILELAIKGLVVEIDPSPAIMGEVKPDPRRAGKRVVFINTKLFLAEFDRRDSSLDLTKWVVHEVFQTIINTTTNQAYDTDEEISRKLRFEEKEFDLWRKRQNPGYPTAHAPLKPGFKLVRGFYTQWGGLDFLKSALVSYDSDWDQFSLYNVRDRVAGAPGYNIGNDDNYGPESVPLKAATDDRGQITYTLAEPVEFRHAGNSCPFQYELEIRPFEDGFHLREKVALNSTRYHATGRCELKGYQWRTHRAYHLTPQYQPYAYMAWAERATSPEEKATAQLFAAAFYDRESEMDTALRAGANPKLKDWNGRTALEISARAGSLKAMFKLIPISDLTDGLFAAATESDNYYCVSCISEQNPAGGAPKDLDRLLEALNLIVRAGSPTLKARALGWLVDYPYTASKHPLYAPLVEFCLVGADARQRASILPTLIGLHRMDAPRPEIHTLVLELVKQGIEPGQSHFLSLQVAMRENEPFFWELLSAGLDPRSAGSYGSLLFTAAANEKVELGKRLIAEFQLDPNLKKENGETALSAWYLFVGDVVYDWLVPITNINVRIGKDDRETLLIRVGRYFSEMHQKETQYAKLMERLLVKTPGGAEVNALDNDGRTVLDWVALRLKALTDNYHRVSPQDPNFQYARSTYLWLVTHYQAKHGSESAPPSWILNGH